MLHPMKGAVLLTALVLTAPVGALAQTVEDYGQALAQAPIIDAPVATAHAHCRPLETYVETSLPDWKLKMPWLLAVLPFDRSVDPVIEQKRNRCQEFRGMAVVTFDDRSGEPIVSPPMMEDPNRAYNAEPVALPPL